MTANNGSAFPYWTDRHAKELISGHPSIYAESDTIFWTSRRNHIYHCQYNLFRLADSLRTGAYIAHNEEQSVVDHIHHCVKTIMEFALQAPAQEIDATDVIVEATFGFC